MVAPELVVLDADAWRAWLVAHEDEPDGVWLVLAKKGTTEPTTLTYAQALDEALCSGWIDGQKRSRDAATFLQRFTPRRKASLWSERNIGLVATLTAAGRMRDRGQAEVDRAKADGRWDRAYAGAATATVPEDLQCRARRRPRGGRPVRGPGRDQPVRRAAPGDDGPEPHRPREPHRQAGGDARTRRDAVPATRALTRGTGVDAPPAIAA